MSRLSLRVRVALAAALAIAIAVALLGFATLTLVDRQLRRSLDDGLRDRAREVARLAATTPRLLMAAGVLEGRVGTSAAYVQVVDSQGRIVARSGALGGRVLPEGAALAAALSGRSPRFGTLGLGDERLRVYAAPLSALGGGEAAGGAVAVAGATRGIDEIVDPLRRLVLIAALAAAAVAALLAVLLTRRALRPLTRLTDDAEAIARTGDPARRLGGGGAAGGTRGSGSDSLGGGPDGGRPGAARGGVGADGARAPAAAPHDEVGRLTATLNAMLDSLAHARGRERRFVEDASHELRTPLTALRGNAAYVARHGADAEALADIEADAERLAQLLDDLLLLAREDAAGRPFEAPAGEDHPRRRGRGGAAGAPSTAGAPGEDAPPAGTPAQTIDLAQLARSVAADHPRVRVTATGGAARVRGDGAALERALRNLVENAERHGPPQTPIEVAVAGGARTARLAVSDAGSGLTPAEAERAFQRFWRGEGAAPGGSGLGLAIVRATAERHGGRVTVTGSTFTLELPLTVLSRSGRRTSASLDAEEAP